MVQSIGKVFLIVITLASVGCWRDGALIINEPIGVVENSLNADHKGHPLVIFGSKIRAVRRTLVELPSVLVIDCYEAVGSSHLSAVKNF